MQRNGTSFNGQVSDLKTKQRPTNEQQLKAAGRAEQRKLHVVISMDRV